MSVRSRLGGEDNGTEEGQGNVKIGANAVKRGVTFFPVEGNEEFNGGEPWGYTYSHNHTHGAARDFRRVWVQLTGYRVTITGHNLRMLLRQIVAGHRETVEQADSLQAGRAQVGEEVITGLILEELGEG